MNFKKVVLPVISFFIVSNSYSLSNNEVKAEVAGAYWSTVIMASEFKNSYCGKSLNLDKKYTDVTAAKIEIFNSFPKSVHAELNKFLTKEKEMSLRNEFYSWWVKVPNDKCDEAQKLFWKIFDESFNKWKTAK